MRYEMPEQGWETRPWISDFMLADAIRELLPLAEAGVRQSGQTKDVVVQFRRAEHVLRHWVAQKKDRNEMLAGPIHASPTFEPDYEVDLLVDDAGIEPVVKEIVRPKRSRKNKVIQIRKEV